MAGPSIYRRMSLQVPKSCHLQRHDHYAAVCFVPAHRIGRSVRAWSEQTRQLRSIQGPRRLYRTKVSGGKLLPHASRCPLSMMGILDNMMAL